MSNRLMSNRKRVRGASTVEFTIVGIPLVFLLFSMANMCFAMLTYHTLQEAVEQGARYVVTKGSTCSSGTNSCTASFANVVSAVANSASGVSGTNLTVTLQSASGSKSCGRGQTNSISQCASGASCPVTCSSAWPPTGDNAPGQDITISADATVAAPMMMMWVPSTTRGITSAHFYAYSRQRLVF